MRGLVVKTWTPGRHGDRDPWNDDGFVKVRNWLPSKVGGTLYSVTNSQGKTCVSLTRGLLERSVVSLTVSLLVIQG